MRKQGDLTLPFLVGNGRSRSQVCQLNTHSGHLRFYMYVVWLKSSIFLKFCGLKAVRPLMLLWGNVLFAFGCTREELKEVQMTTIINCWPVGSISLMSAWVLMIKERGQKTKLHLPNQAHQPAPLGLQTPKGFRLGSSYSEWSGEAP